MTKLIGDCPLLSKGLLGRSRLFVGCGRDWRIAVRAVVHVKSEDTGICQNLARKAAELGFGQGAHLTMFSTGFRDATRWESEAVYGNW